MDPNFLQSIHNLLIQSTSNDTVQIKAATAQLNKDYYKNPLCIPALTQILASSPQEAIRQFAAVELRKRIAQNSSKLWVELSGEDRNQIKTQLPNVILNETFKLVRHSTARVISAIASIEIPNGTWAALLPFLNDCCTSNNVAHREVGIFILFTTLENIVEGFQEHLPSLFALFERLLRDPESIEVRVTTVRAMGVVAQYIDSDDKAEIKSFQALLAAMLEVVVQTVEAGDATSGRHVFDVFETLLILEIPLLGKSVPQLVELFLRCGANASYDEEMRIMALNALSWTVKYKKTKIQGANLAAAILAGLIPITTEAEPDDVDDDAPSRSALRIIDTLSTSLPPAQVFPALQALVSQYMSSADPAHRRGSMHALGVAVEGCSEYMTPLMDSQVWPLVEAGLKDSDASVRKAVCTTVGCLCDWLEESCVEKHATLIPAIMNMINDETTQRPACTALDAILEISHDVIHLYLDLLMTKLAGLLETAPLKVKSVVTGAIGSAAHASKNAFLPYFVPTMNHMKQFLEVPFAGNEELIELRGITMDAIGTFAEAVGREPFRPYFQEMMNHAFTNIQPGVAGSTNENGGSNARLRECSFLFFGVMARVFSDEFTPFLPSVIPKLIESCSQPEHEIGSADEQALFTSGASSSTKPEGEIDIEELDDDKLLDVSSAIAVEKEIAADTIGTIFSATRAAFLPYVEKCTLELVALLPHYYEGIRKSATESLLEIVRTFSELSEPAPWQPGKNVPVKLHQTVQDLISHVLPPLIEMNESEDDKTVAAALCAGFAETMNAMGPGFLGDHLDDVTNIAVQILEQKAMCQQDPDQDESEEPLEDSAEYDSVLISSAGDLVAAIANTLGADFAPAFETFYPLITRYYKKSRSVNDRSAAIGCLAEIINGMKQSVTPFTQKLMELFYTALSDEDPEVNSNAAFASGLLIEFSEMDLSAQYLAILAALRPFFIVSDDAPTPKFNARDNAAGAVARMIVKNTNAVPLDQVLPVFIGVLPLKNDYLENRPIFNAIFHLYRTNPLAIGPYAEQLLRVFRQVLDPSGPDQLGFETRAELLDLVRALHNENSGAVQAAGLVPYIA